MTAHDASTALVAYRAPAEAVLSALGSDRVRGLSRTEARQRLERDGPNELTSAGDTPWWRRLAEQFANVLVIILLAATIISMIEWLLQEPRESALPYEAIVILAIVVLNALLGFVQEQRAERSVRALMALAAPEATVIRDGERQRTATREIVPGDLLLVEAGDRIPADARVIEAANLCRSTWRSALSGLFDNGWLAAAVALSLCLHLLVIYLPFLQAAFHTVALSLADWLIATGTAATLLVATELAKMVLRRKRRAAQEWR